MDDLKKLLQSRGLAQPPEIERIKSYVKNKYDSNVNVMLKDKDIILVVKEAALANSLKLNLIELKKDCQIDTKIIIRIGS